MINFKRYTMRKEKREVLERALLFLEDDLDTLKDSDISEERRQLRLNDIERQIREIREAYNIKRD